MNFDFKAITKTVPGVCIVGGIALTIISKVADLGGSLFALGVFLLIAGIVLQVIYLYLRYKN